MLSMKQLGQERRLPGVVAGPMLVHELCLSERIADATIGDPDAARSIHRRKAGADDPRHPIAPRTPISSAPPFERGHELARHDVHRAACMGVSARNVPS